MPNLARRTKPFLPYALRSRRNINVISPNTNFVVLVNNEHLQQIKRTCAYSWTRPSRYQDKTFVVVRYCPSVFVTQEIHSIDNDYYFYIANYQPNIRDRLEITGHWLNTTDLHIAALYNEGIPHPYYEIVRRGRLICNGLAGYLADHYTPLPFNQ